MTNTANPSLAAGAAAPAPRGRRVIDAPIRMFHWLSALSFLGAYLTADGESWRALHVTLGYTLAGLLAFRVVYGLAGPRQARLSALGNKLSMGSQWLRGLVSRRKVMPGDGTKGQNLLMAAAIASVLLLVLPLTLSGYATYNEWGGDWLEEVHEFFGNTLLAIVLLHVGLVVGLSVLRKRNLAGPMLTGRMPGNGPDLVRSNKAWLAALVLLAVLAFGAWEWQQAPQGLLPAAGMEHERGHGPGHDDDD